MFQTALVPRARIPSHQWDDFVRASPQHSIYALSWYLDAIQPDWQAIIVSKRDQWLAVLPLNIKRKASILYALQPTFAQYLGILFAPASTSKSHVFSVQKKLITLIVKSLPKQLIAFDYYFHPAFQYFLPFHWNQFEVRPRFSYELDLDKSYEKLRQAYSSRIKVDLKKAEKGQLTCEKGFSIAKLLHQHQCRNILNQRECRKFRELWEGIDQRKMGFILESKDSAGNILSSGAFIQYQNRLIFPLLSATKAGRKCGASALLVDKAIQYACDSPLLETFDFKGSMIEGVEQYFRGFNPDPITYYQIQKIRLPFIYQAYQGLKSICLKQVS